MTAEMARSLAFGRGRATTSTPQSWLADVDPIGVDDADFASVGGLDEHVFSLKEMIILPLLYPDLLEKFSIKPIRGVLFHGPPGTGKTLVARALAHECSRISGQKVAFFIRKGADCLSKWVGESERQLHLLFEQAHLLRPSVVFFDELDGLAPVRSSKQDQIHSSIVSTLLALMDGLEDRGQVVVIGATNRLDAIDPALRRPGRFDRELLFSLPTLNQRMEIFRIHTRTWVPPLSLALIQEVMEHCDGYSGADIRHLCTEAAFDALREKYPQIYEKPVRFLLDTSALQVSKHNFIRAAQKIKVSSQRNQKVYSKALPKYIEPLYKVIIISLYLFLFKL
ncbi:ATPase family AAA domain-containing protein 2-like [Zophobas morio]|uniref:ATPase family AAA domain-containing protein 2-like n=1 Tax=Zophobas morio TaxID=2755281 RepID=UPI0030831CB5